MPTTSDIKSIIDNYAVVEYGITADDLGSEPYTYQRITHQFNTAHAEIFNEAAIATCYLLETQVEFTIDSNTTQAEVAVDLPDNLTTISGLAILDTDGNALTWPIPIQNAGDRTMFSGQTLWGWGRVAEDKLYFIRPNANNYLLVYYRFPGKLHYGNVADADELTLVADPASIVGLVSKGIRSYTGDHLKIYEGLGAGQTRKIALYDPDAYEFTLELPWTTIPDDTSKFSILPTTPDNFTQLLVWGAGKNMVNDPGLMGKLQGKFDNALIQFRETYQPRSDTTPNRIKIVEDNPAIQRMGSDPAGPNPQWWN